jgi:hypothetical protein
MVKPEEYNLDNLTFNPLANPRKKTLQTNLLPSYKGERSPMIQIPAIDLDMYGVPSKCDIYKEDYQRMFLRLPLNQENAAIKALTEGFLSEFDNKFGSRAFRETVLNSRPGKYNYQPLVRFPEEPGRHPYIKLKLLTEYPSNMILTGVVEEKEVNGEPQRDLKPDTQCIDNFSKYFPLRANLTCVIVPAKLWIHPANSHEFNYGITFKLVKVLVKMPLSEGLKDVMKNGCDFIF